MKEFWPENLPVAQVRIARPTDKLEEVEQFYCAGLGLKKLGAFTNHAGYDGIMIGLPGFPYHLEFISHEDGSPCPAPSKENLLVLYIPNKASIARMLLRLEQLDYYAIEPENPYWKEKEAITIEDPDGWRLVLMPTAGIN
jgi:hypothetical protein